VGSIGSGRKGNHNIFDGITYVSRVRGSIATVVHKVERNINQEFLIGYIIGKIVIELEDCHIYKAVL
jgi:hypothetical protein